MFIAPTEPPALKAIGKSSLLPESYGVDCYFIGTSGRKCGIQRKEIKDLLASVNDGRLVKEVLQMEALDYKVLIVEGKAVYSEDGYLLNNTFGKQWTKSQFDGLLWSIQDRGIWLVRTDSLNDTIETVQRMERWFKKSSHESLSRRPGIGKGILGAGPTSDEVAAWILQSVPGIGPKLADKIVSQFGQPLRLELTTHELQQIDGVGKKKADSIVGMFNASK